MRLIPLTTRYFLLLFLFVSGLGALLLYQILQFAVYEHIDEMLKNRKHEIVRKFKEKNGHINALVTHYTNFSIKEIKRRDTLPQDQFTDTLIYAPTDNEFDQYRKYRTHFQYKGQVYQLSIIQPRLETGEMVMTIALSLLGLLGMMTICFVWGGKWLSRKLWQPFYETLDKLRSFDLEKGRDLQLRKTSVHEFQKLNEALKELTQKVNKTYLSQKQFTEDASHELKTPLANLQSKLELMLETPDLTQQQANKIHELIQSVKRLTNLNKTLLMLAKVDNRQLPEKKVIHINQTVEDLLADFEETKERQRIQINVELNESVTVSASPDLLEVLIKNLLKNAFKHNTSDGKIWISLDSGKLEIANTSSQKAIPKDQLFQRFYKGSANTESWGLGLALAAKICEVNGWHINYHYKAGAHSFRVYF